MSVAIRIACHGADYLLWRPNELLSIPHYYHRSLLLLLICDC
jgi:hypothetical protein